MNPEWGTLDFVGQGSRKRAVYHPGLNEMDHIALTDLFSVILAFQSHV